MGFLSSKTPAGSDNAFTDSEKNQSSSEKPQDVSEVTPHGPVTSSEGEEIPESYQEGVRRIEAAATVWTKWHLVAAYVM